MSENKKMLPDMEITDLPEGAEYEEMELTYYDGDARRIYVVDEEVPYPDGRLIVSRTDLSGRITHANKAFVDMSAYSEEELVGSAHSILRHPDVPGVIFKQMWDTISSGKPWYGYVKNLRKDGRYYWVYASVNPCFIDGKLSAYTSVRRKPARDKVEETLDLIGKIHSGEVVLQGLFYKR